MQFDDILIQLGQFGRYQKKQYFLLCIPAICAAFHQFSSVFLAGEPDFRCRLPDYSGFNGTDSYAIQDIHNHSAKISMWIPIKIEDNETQFDACKVWDQFHNKTVDCGLQYVYNETVFKETIVNKWNVVCGEKWRITLSTSIYMLGVLFGSFGFGMLSDAIGRKKTLLISLGLQGVSGIAVAFAPEFYSFMLFRLVVGSASMGVFMTCFVMGMELIGPSWRLFAGIVIEYFFALGFVILTPIAWGLRHWKWIQLTISIPSFFFLSYWWLVPESARWLIAKNRREEAEEIIQTAAKENGVRIPEKVLSGDLDDVVEEKITKLFSSRKLVIRTLVIFFNWLVVAMGYYGLSLNSGKLGGDVYLNFLLAGLVEFPAYTVCFICNKIGRKIPHVFGMFIGGGACLVLVIVDYYVKETIDKDTFNTIQIALNMTGKFGMTMGFAIIYFWSAEIYPTTVRNSLMGWSSTLARVGSISAPFINYIGDLVDPKYKVILPSSIFGSLVVLGGLLSIILPETANTELPETIEEAANFPHHKLVREKSTDEVLNFDTKM